MLLTEEQAKEKWCPFARVWACDVEGDGDNVSINRFGDTEKTLHPNAMCIGSACMAWRPEFKRTFSEEEAPGEWVERLTGLGFCGLAGPPK